MNKRLAVVFASPGRRADNHSGFARIRIGGSGDGDGVLMR